MKRPPSGVVRVERDGDVAHRRDPHGVAHRAGKALALDCNHLEMVAVQVHRVAHHAPIVERQLDALASAEEQPLAIIQRFACEGPGICRHVAAEHDRLAPISGHPGKRPLGTQAGFEKRSRGWVAKSLIEPIRATAAPLVASTKPVRSLAPSRSARIGHAPPSLGRRMRMSTR